MNLCVRADRSGLTCALLRECEWEPSSETGIIRTHPISGSKRDNEIVQPGVYHAEKGPMAVIIPSFRWKLIIPLMVRKSLATETTAPEILLPSLPVQTCGLRVEVGRPILAEKPITQLEVYLECVAH